LAQLTLNPHALAGLTPTFVAATAGGDAFSDAGDERTYFRVKNGGASTITVTIAPVSPTSIKVAGATPQAVSLPSYSVSVAAAADTTIGPFPSAYRDANSNVNVTYSAVTSVTVAAIRMPIFSQ
jgi:hypothetical protein